MVYIQTFSAINHWDKGRKGPNSIIVLITIGYQFDEALKNANASLNISMTSKNGELLMPSQ